MKNDATSSPEGAQRNVGDKYAKLSELWSKLAKGGVIHRRIKRNFRAKRQTPHRKITLLPFGRDVTGINRPGKTANNSRRNDRFGYPVENVN